MLKKRNKTTGSAVAFASSRDLTRCAATEVNVLKSGKDSSFFATFTESWPGLVSRPSTLLKRRKKNVDARDKRGHNAGSQRDAP
jgi:hypothetical protein